VVSGDVAGSFLLLAFGAATFAQCIVTGRIPNSAMHKVTRETRPLDFWIAAGGFGLLGAVGLYGVVRALL
jgi:hypothetical protein